MEWNLDPIAFYLGPRGITYYGVLFFSAMLLNYLVINYLQKKFWQRPMNIDYFFYGAFIFAVGGGRFVHLAFYEWPRFSNNPLVFFDFFSGGQASHGVFLGAIIWIIIFSKYTKRSIIQLLDTIAPSVAMGASFIRIGNFCNSEIVGKVTDIPWAIKFLRYDQYLRHPVQLYEFLLLFLLSLLLFYGVNKRKWFNVPGLCASLWLTIYMGGRGFVELFKARLVFAEADSGLSMGQFLSSIPALVGVIWLVLIYLKRRKT